jgi:hypothetical protein
MPLLLSATANASHTECHTPRLVVGRLAHLGLHLGVVHHRCSASAIASWPSVSKHTILGLAESRLEVIEREVAHLVLEGVEIHGGGCACRVLVVRCVEGQLLNSVRGGRRCPMLYVARTVGRRKVSSEFTIDA